MMAVTKVAVWGAGEFGLKLAGVLLENALYDVTIFIDDDDSRVGKNINGVQVVSYNEITTLYTNGRFHKIIIAISNLNSHEKERITKFLKSVDIPFSIVGEPSVFFYANANFNPQAVYDLEFLLGREKVAASLELMNDAINGKTILVTGAGGSIGSEIARQVSVYKPQKLILVDNSEAALYQISYDVSSVCHSLKINFASYARDVACHVEMRDIFTKHDIDSVFHAAAYKHVPNVESDPLPGLKNNVLGTKVLLENACHFGVKNFTLVSTDKAVRPTSKMGASKRICEELCQCYQRCYTDTNICSVRFGNVAGSSGSIIPLFSGQIDKGGPVTVTHPHVNRYFMGIIEAAQLVIQASSISKGGETFLLEMGEPIFILDLAKKMIEQRGLKWTIEPNLPREKEILIKFIGLRNGEKMSEELSLDGVPIQTRHPKIYISDEDLQINVTDYMREINNFIKAFCRFDEIYVEDFLSKYISV